MGGQYIQPFTFADTALGSAVATFNVVGWLPRGKPTTWVIGAHYDHLGQGGSHSHEVGRTGIHNGADDNASGVALLLLLAQYVQQHPNLPCNFLFVAFGGHEPGLYGSAHFVRTFSDSLPRWGGMLNFDMVGRLDARTHTVGVAGLAIANPCHNRLRTGAEALGLRLRDRMDWITGSDHAAFYQAGVPVLAFTTGRHTDYHRMTDDAHRLNYPGICILQQWLSTWLAGN
jgi:Zn-dependent M28 family amino/carboxypeptidase